MRLQAVTGEWLYTRHISVYYIRNEKSIEARLMDGSSYCVLCPENENVDQDLLDDMVKIISILKLSHHTVSQHDLWRELNKIRK